MSGLEIYFEVYYGITTSQQSEEKQYVYKDFIASYINTEI